MSELRGHFGGVVEDTNKDSVFVRVDTVCREALVEKGALVEVSRENFASMGAGPYPAKEAHVEGNVVRDAATGKNRYINLTAIA